MAALLAFAPRDEARRGRMHFADFDEADDDVEALRNSLERFRIRSATISRVTFRPDGASTSALFVSMRHDELAAGRRREF